jgi:predicted nucleic acid-binding protein
MTDCISFIVMQDMGIIDALTSDDHFRQAGFRALPVE